MASEIPITRTKILVPHRRDEILSRPRLLDQLTELLDARLLIISAPPGYGKTSLLVDFANHTELPVCWFTIDPLDQDLQHFLAHFITSLRLKFPQFGQTSLAAVTSVTQDNLDQDMLCTTLVNDIYEHIKEHFILVLDDYHLLNENPRIETFLTGLIRNVDENCHLVLCSRNLVVLPDLPLMVARAQVAGLGYEDLAFLPNEIQALMLQNYQRSIPSEQADQLAQQTEGWITGLLLTTQVGDSVRTARVLGVGLYDYLAGQVFDSQPADICTFLLRTSLLEEFDAAFCEEVIAQALELPPQDWNHLIDQALAFNLFILPVGEDGLTLRYHNLFRDFLQERMQHDFPYEAARIHLRLADVYSQRGEWERAFDLYRRLDRVDEMMGLIERAGAAMIAGGRLVTLGSWLEELPIGAVENHPGLLSVQAGVAMMRGDPVLGLSLASQAVAGLSSNHDVPALALTLIRRSTANRMVGNYQQALSDAERALGLVEQNPNLAFYLADALRVKGNCLYQQGKLRDALGCLTQSVMTYQNLKDEESAAQALLEVGVTNQALGSTQAAEAAYSRALKYWQTSANMVWQANILNNLGVLQHLRGDYITASQTLEKAVQTARAGYVPRVEAYSLTSLGDLYRDLDALDEAEEAYKQARGISYHISDQGLTVYLDLAEAILARLRGRLPLAQQMTYAAQQKAEAGGSLFEQNLSRMEFAVEQLIEKDYCGALPTLAGVSAYFSNEGSQVEAGLSHLYLSITLHQAGDYAACASQLREVYLLITESDTAQPILAAGRHFKAVLEKIATRPELNPLVARLLQRIDDFENQISTLRKHLRRHVSAVPFAQPRIIIRALGRMQVRINGKLVRTADWQVQSARDLFFLILSFQEGLTKEEIGNIFWPDSTPAELKLRFKNTVYRLRRAIGHETISFDDELYRFNRDLDYEYDVETFLNEITLAQQAAGTDQRVRHFQIAIRNYRGLFMPEVEETWVVSERERLQHIFIDSVTNLIELHLTARRYDQALEYCQRALEGDACLEAAHRYAMQAHAALGNRAAVQRQYEQCRRSLSEEMDITPSTQTEKVFKELMKKV
jgi:ATP/maltotriose-dependent transcriptional regulator MalT/two-component SAPR family response regulator